MQTPIIIKIKENKQLAVQTNQDTYHFDGQRVMQYLNLLPKAIKLNEQPNQVTINDNGILKITHANGFAEFKPQPPQPTKTNPAKLPKTLVALPQRITALMQAN